MCTQEHGANFVVIAADVFMSRAPYRLAHTHHAASYAASYLFFSIGALRDQQGRMNGFNGEGGTKTTFGWSGERKTRMSCGGIFVRIM
jgi:hypothetical protein